jgi:hypothetical protein
MKIPRRSWIDIAAAGAVSVAFLVLRPHGAVIGWTAARSAVVLAVLMVAVQGHCEACGARRSLLVILVLLAAIVLATGWAFQRGMVGQKSSDSGTATLWLLIGYSSLSFAAVAIVGPRILSRYAQSVMTALHARHFSLADEPRRWVFFVTVCVLWLCTVAPFAYALYVFRPMPLIRIPPS